MRHSGIIISECFAYGYHSVAFLLVNCDKPRNIATTQDISNANAIGVGVNNIGTE